MLPTSKPRSIAREGPDSEIDSPPAKVADLNKNPKLPYEDNAFDFVTNVVSVDYLVKPREVFEEMHRVLKPGGWDVFWILLASHAAAQVWPSCPSATAASLPRSRALIG